MTLAFHMTAEQALQFFELCHVYQLHTEEERLDLLREMIEAGFDITVFQTNRSPDQVVQDAAKNYGNVLHFKMTEEPKDENDSKTKGIHRRKHDRRTSSEQ